MLKKYFLLFLSFSLFIASFINIGWRVSVNDVFLPGCYTSSQIKSAEEISALAAEELSRFKSSSPELRRRLHLSFRPYNSDSRVLNDYMLLYSDGVCLADGIFVNGTALGTVENGSVLNKLLRESIKNQMPNAAVFGSISGRLQIRPVFSSQGHVTNYEDMVLLISGMAPVFYVDKNGHLA